MIEYKDRNVEEVHCDQKALPLANFGKFRNGDAAVQLPVRGQIRHAFCVLRAPGRVYPRLEIACIGSRRVNGGLLY